MIQVVIQNQKTLNIRLLLLLGNEKEKEVKEIIGFQCMDASCENQKILVMVENGVSNNPNNNLGDIFAFFITKKLILKVN